MLVNLNMARFRVNLSAVDIPSILEPLRMDRGDDKRPDELRLRSIHATGGTVIGKFRETKVLFCLIDGKKD